MLIISLVLLPFLCAIPSIVIRGPFPSDCTSTQKNVISLFQEVDDVYYVFNDQKMDKVLTAYATVRYNLSTPSGTYDTTASLERYMTLKKFYSSIKEKDCKGIKDLKEELNVKYLISYNKECELLLNCGFGLYKQKNNACIYV